METQFDFLIIGASIAGLIQAALLAAEKSLSSKTIGVLESSEEPVGPVHRPVITQDQHIHVISALTYQTLCARIPGFAEKLEAAGVRLVEWGTKDIMLFLTPKGALTQNHSFNFVTPNVTRPVLEHVLREVLSECPNVHFLYEHWVTGYLFDSQHKSVIGVEGEHRFQPFKIKAGYVFDASGPSRNTLKKFMTIWGYGPFKEVKLNAGAQYVTRIYRALPKMPADLHFYGVAEDPRMYRNSCAVQRLASKDVLVTLIGYKGNHPPTDPHKFVEFAHGLMAPHLYEWLSDPSAEPLTDPVLYGNCGNSWLELWKLEDWPEGLIVLGDAYVKTNPRLGYGVGMALQEAMLAMRIILSGKSALDYIKQSKEIVEPRLFFAKLIESRFLVDEGLKMSIGDRILMGYLSTVQNNLYRDEVAASIFMRLMNDLGKPLDLFALSVLKLWIRSVLRNLFRR